MKHIVVITESRQEEAHAITGEVIAAAHRLSTITGDEILMVCMRSDGPPDGERQKKMLLSILKGGDVAPAFVVMGHTVHGMDLAPRLAVGLDADCISSVHQIRKDERLEDHALKDDGGLLFVRSLFKGKVDGVWRYSKEGREGQRSVVLTIQAGSFSSNTLSNDKKGDERGVRHLDIDVSLAGAEDEKDSHLQYGAFIQKRGRKSTLGQTRIIVAAGRGIESQENLEKIQRLAACFSDASVAGSRPLIDMGWMPYANQVGITGAVVAPDLYLAMGISGSSQHIAGMAQSKFIVAVNKDPNAAIFNVSDICIVENTLEFIEKLISLARK